MSLQPDADAPRAPRVNLAACLEACGAWCLALMVGGVLAFALVHSLQRQAVQGLHDARLQIALQDIKERLEADLALGFELADSARAQGLLEEALGQDRSLVSAEVFDPQGISLFNTDRGAIGESVPEAWLAALAPAAAGRNLLWTASVDGDTAVGIAVRGPFGEVAGQVSLTSVAVPATSARRLLAVTVLLALLLGTLAWIMVRRSLVRQLADEDDALLVQAWQRLQAGQRRQRDTLASLGEDGQAVP